MSHVPWIHHGVFRELDHDEVLQLDEVLLVRPVERALVVDLGQEPALGGVLGLVQRVVPVLGLHKQTLDPRGVRAVV